jgi:small-conductance mechanosensitive channel
LEEIINNPINQVADQGLAWIAVFLPNAWLQGIFVVGASMTLALIAERLLTFALTPLIKIQFKTGYQNGLIDSIKKPFFIIFFLALTSVSLPLVNLPGVITTLFFSLMGTLATILWFLFAVKTIKIFLIIAGDTKGRYDFIQSATVPLFDNSAKIILFLAATYFIFLSWGINVSALLASAGIFGLALSFGAQNTLANIFGGMSILADAPFKVGDYINLDSGERGEVTHIGLRSTRILTRDDVEISVPNNVMSNAKIINESGGPYTKFRIRISVSVAYGTDIDLVEKILVELAKDHNEICVIPEPRVRFRKFGPSSLDFELLGWCEQPALRGKHEHELNSMIYNAFNQNGIKIPFPQHEVHISNLTSFDKE